MGPKGKKIFKVDCSTPAQDDIMDADLMNAYQQYLAENIKLHGRKGKLGDKVKITQENNVVTVATGSASWPPARASTRSSTSTSRTARRRSKLHSAHDCSDCSQSLDCLSLNL